MSFGQKKHAREQQNPYGTQPPSSVEGSGTKSNKPPHVPSLKEKMQKTSL